jgi:predicted nuclease of restriction endonuclease-like (RecB) superfamily
MNKLIKSTYRSLLKNIGSALQQGKESAVQSVNTELVKMNWAIGKYIVEFEQGGKNRAEYGAVLLKKLSRDLKLRHGKGFGLSNLQYIRLFYITYSKSSSSSIYQTVSGILSWSHYTELLSITDDLARSFYEKQALKEGWSFREMKRQIDTSLFQRLALSKNKKGILALAKKGHIIKVPKDAIKSPFIFEFLGIENTILKEKGLETKLINNLQKFLLELGKGFSFVARQFKITLDNQHHFIDLVFYHRILKCFVLIDLKTRKVKHGDIGQMNLYLNYFKEEESTQGDNEPIGIIIAADKHDLLVKYATGGLSNKIFVSKYQLYLPNQRILEKKMKEILASQ